MIIAALNCDVWMARLLAATSGNASLQNLVDLSISCLKHIPPYGHREVLVMSAALSTCDPGNVFDSVKVAKEHHIR